MYVICIFHLFQAPLIKSIEFKVQSIHSKRSHLLIKRRRQDVTDESEECRVGVANDEGRQGRIVEREGRRRRRREKRQREESVIDHYEGMSSDDELLETDKIRFNKELGTSGIDLYMYMYIWYCCCFCELIKI